MEVDGGTGLGTQVGLRPNELNNQSHGENETPKTDGETPAETVEKLLDSAPAIASSSTTLNTPAYFSGDRPKCELRNLCGQGPFCLYNGSTPQAYATHVVLGHIYDELSKIRSGELKMDQAELLVSQKKIRRAENYEWICPAPECTMATLKHGEMMRHVDLVHKQMKLPSTRRRKRKLTKTRLIDVMLHILAAD